MESYSTFFPHKGQCFCTWLAWILYFWKVLNEVFKCSTQIKRISEPFQRPKDSVCLVFSWGTETQRYDVTDPRSWLANDRTQMETNLGLLIII